MLIFFIAVVRIVSPFLKKNFLLFCDDIEKSPRPVDASKLSKLSTLNNVLFGAQNGLKFLVFNDCIIHNKYQDISKLLP